MELGQLGVLRGPKCPGGPGSSGAVQWVLGFRPLEGKGRSQKLDFLSCPVHTCSRSAETHSGVEPPSPLCPVSLNPAPGCFHHVQGQAASQGGTTWPFPAQEDLSESHGLRVKSSLLPAGCMFSSSASPTERPLIVLHSFMSTHFLSFYSRTQSHMEVPEPGVEPAHPQEPERQQSDA